MADNDLPPGFSTTPPKPLDVARNYFKEKGNFLNPHAADALAATSFSESGGDPYATNSKSKALGLFQHLGPRKSGLVSTGDIRPQGQAEYAFKELSSGKYPRSWEALNDPKLSRDQVEKVLIDEFEAPGGSAERGYGPAEGDLSRARQYTPPKDAPKQAAQPKAQSNDLPPGFSFNRPAGPQDPSIQARQKMPQAAPDGAQPGMWDKLTTAIKSPDFLANVLGKIGQEGERGVDALLTPTSKLDPVNLIPNREKLARDIKAYLFEGGNITDIPSELQKPLEEAKTKATGVPEPSKSGLTIEKGDVSGVRQGEHGYIAKDQSGKPVLEAIVKVYQNKARVQDIHGVYDLENKSISAGPNTLGPTVMRDLLNQLKKDHPQVTQITGARRTGAGPSNREANVPVPTGAAATPVGRIAEQNIRDFDEANKAPAMKDRLKDATTAMKAYFDTSDKAKAMIQKNAGRNQRMAAQASQAMNEFKQFTGSLNIDEQIDLLKWLQDPQAKLSKGLQLSPEADKFVSTFHDWMHTYQKELEKLPQAEKMNFRQNFVSQLWKQPEGAMKYINEYGAKKGSSYFTKARVFDDYEAGIRAGFAPVTTNPVEIFSRYVENASKKIASWQTENDAKDAGMLVYRAPNNAPEGWVPLRSVGHNIPGQQAYAPPGLAKIFDNYASQPMQFNIPGTNIDMLAGAQKAANGMTAFKLGISGFHPALETMEGVFSGIANGITKAKNGRPIAGIADALTAARKPFTSFARGRQLQQAYLDGNFGKPEMQRIVRALTDANYDPLREGGIADEYRVSRLPGFIKGWQKGIPMTAGGPLKTAIRAFETTMEPTFQYYVPWLKNQAAYDAMKTYLDAHPEVSPTDFAAYGRKVSSNIDARFGEINKNNIFLNATQKRMAQTAMISYSFTLGQARQVLGAAWDAARIPDKAYSRIKGTLPSTEEIWTDRLSYAMAIGLGTAFVDSVYQYLKTGQLPQNMQDVMSPRTGGADPSTQQPERAKLPNFANSYMNIWQNGIGQELYNKTNPLWQTLMQMGTNKDWKDQLIRDPNDTVPKQLEQMGTFAYQNALTPITLGTISQAKEGTHISSLERLFGIRAAGMKDTDPEKLKQIVSYKNAEAWYEKRKSDMNQQRAEKGLGPLRISHHERSLLIEKYMKNPQADPLQSYGGTQ